MENSCCTQNHSAKEEESLPSLIKAIASNDVAAGFDDGSVQEQRGSNSTLKSTRFHPSRTSNFEIEATAMENRDELSNNPRKVQSVSISMPPSPVEAHLKNKKSVFFKNNDDTIPGNDGDHHDTAGKDVEGQKAKAKFYSQPIPKGSVLIDAVLGGYSPNRIPLRNPRIDKVLDKRFDSFKTSYHDSFKAWSGKLEKQLSNLRGVKPREIEEGDQDETDQLRAETNLPEVHRYFDALEGPELDTLRPSEELLLPDDKKWPFLLRFPISSFGICLGVSSQAIMWKTLSSSESTAYLHITPDINIFLWLVSVALVFIVSVIYGLKLILYFEAVRREYYHPIRVNFFFAPFIALLFLAMGIPPSFKETLHESLWYILMAPFLALELKIYGQWMSGGQRRLSKVANPSNHLSVVGNFVGALLGASMGLKEGPIFFFAVGLAHYTVLFVTLYQRLPTNETLPKELHPVFFLFVAAPSVASMAWAKIQGSFDYGSRIAYFIAMFLYFSLAVRVNFFRGIRFSLSWWAYTFPMTGAAIATIKYSNVVTNVVTKTLTIALCTVATLTVSALLATTIFHAFVLRDLFPNDIAIAIRERRPKATSKRWYHLRTAASESNIDQYLKYKYSCDDEEDMEASINNPPSLKRKDLSCVFKKGAKFCEGEKPM